ncbi:MAG: glycoside hydrolase family 3 C-terminal domain-containing protein [Planctomycetia bacterium]|nr:glycoside hydrolase family 3 C-terminal domain-containing protein [Planctomycetia bacterium]
MLCKVFSATYRPARIAAVFGIAVLVKLIEPAIAAQPKQILFNAASANLVVNGDFSANALLYTHFPGYSTAPNPAAPADWKRTSNPLVGINGSDTGLRPATGSPRVGSVGGIANGASTQPLMPFAPDRITGVRDFAFLQGSGASLSQTVATAPGKAYVLSYAAAARGSDVPANQDALRVRIANAVNGQTIVMAAPVITPAAFKMFAITFTAPSASTRIEFINASPAGALAGGTVDVSDVKLATPAIGKSTAPVAFEYSPIGLTASQINRRAETLLRRMTLAEKVRLLSGNGHEALHSIKSVGIPSIKVSDATVGIVEWGPSTAYPAAPCLTSSWNRKLAGLEGQHIGIDARAKHVGILLGPGLNILRQPQNGRSMEYIGGEDPFLASQMVVPYIKGLQSEDVAACCKHFVGNEIETMRPWINCIISRRALEEIYLPPFRAAVRQGYAWALMTACNRINGQYGSENHFFLTAMLRKKWGFKGLTMSDWGCSYNTMGNLTAGLDLEMPATKEYTLQAIRPLLKQHKISMALVNQRVRQILRLIVAMGFNDPNNPFRHRPANTSGDAAVVDQVAAEGTVLLKNRDHILPLHPSRPMNIVFVGPWTTRVVTGGGGSSHVPPAITPLTLFKAVKQVAGPRVHLAAVPWSDTYKPYWGRGVLTTPDGQSGVVADYYSNGNFGGKPTRVIQRNISLNAKLQANMHASNASGNSRTAKLMAAVIASTHQARLGKAPISVIWKAAIHPTVTGEYSFICAVNGSGEVYLDGRRIIDLWLPFWQNPVHPLKGALTTLRLCAGQTYQIRVVYRSLANKAAVIGFGWVPRKKVHLFTPAQRNMIRHADAVIACMGFNQTIQREQADRPYNLTGPQNEYLRDAALLNPHTIAVVYAGAGVGMEKWVHHVAGLLWGWYPGQSGNISIAKIIFGQIDPSGHLPDTFSRYWRNEAAYHHFPGYPGVFNHRWQDEPAYAGFPSGVGSRCKFVEGIYIGYRWYDYKHIRPLFPFGFGLSYTTFALNHLTLASSGAGRHRLVTIHVIVTNTGRHAGATVVQVYVHPPQGGLISRVVQKLEGFQRVTLQPGQSRTITMRLHWKAFATFNTRTNSWVVPPGAYGVAVGLSSADEPLHKVVVW